MQKNTKSTNTHIFTIKNILNKFKSQIVFLLILYAFAEITHALSHYIMTQQYEAIEKFYNNFFSLDQVIWVNVRNTIFWCIMIVFSSCCKVIGGQFFKKIESYVKKSIFDFFHQISYEDFITIQGEKAFNILRNLESTIRDIFSIFIVHIFANILVVIMNISIIFYFMPKLGVVFLVWLVINCGFFLLAYKYSKNATKHMYQITKIMNNNILESFLHVLSIKVNNAIFYEEKNLNNNIKEYQDKCKNFIYTTEIIQATGYLISEIVIWGYGLYIIICALSIIPMPLSQVIFLVMVIYGTVGKVRNISVNSTKFIELLKDYNENKNFLLNYKIEKYLNIPITYKKNIPVIKFKNVKFSLKDQVILDDISFEIYEGEKVCFIGYSGAGKSTVVNLITGIYKHYDGDIEIYGQNIKDIQTENIIEHFNVINQFPVVFGKTVKSNLMGDEIIDEKKMIYYCKLVQIHDFIMSLPNQYNEVIYHKTLSGGQSQRICLARMLMRERSLYIFDEGTNGLDQKTKNLFLTELFNISKNNNGNDDKKNTMLFIDHSLSFLKQINRVIMVEEGKLVFNGDYDSLQKCESFLKLIEIL